LTPPSRRRRYENLLQLFKEELIPQLAPPPDITISEWADQNVWLGPDVTSQPGPWQTSFAPYQKGIMDAISDKTTERIVIMKAARVGITYSAILNPIGYYIHHEPCPIFIVYPTGDNAKKFSKKNLTPFIRDCKPIRSIVTESHRIDSNNTLLLKLFPGGSLTLIGANSPNTMRVDTAKIAMIDEADGDVEMTEGDYIKLVENRTQTFAGRGRKIIILSTPKFKGTSLIEAEYENSTMEKYHLPCPSCGLMQPLEWSRIDLEAATHSCCGCEAGHTKREWTRGWGEVGKWVAANPDHTTRGFHVSALYSPFITWEFIIEEWRTANREAAAGQLGKLQTFINTTLGETWEIRGERSDETGLMERREEYYAEVPDGVCCITVAVDTQDNRLAVDVIGWGQQKESWRLGYHELWGDPRIQGSPVWGQLDEVIRKSYKYANGVAVPVVCTCIDMGGHATEMVRMYCRARRSWNVWAVRGVPGAGKALLYNRVQSKLAGTYEFNLAVDAGKDDVMARLNIKTPGPGYCHFPQGSARDVTGVYESVRGYDERYFAGLTSEQKVLTKTKKGNRRFEWQLIPGRSNEPFDLAVYNLAALEISKFPIERIAARMPWSVDLPDMFEIATEAIKPAFANTPPSPSKPTNRPPLNRGVNLNKQMVKNSYTAV